MDEVATFPGDPGEAAAQPWRFLYCELLRILADSGAPYLLGAELTAGLLEELEETRHLYAGIPLMAVVICRLWIEVDFAREATRNCERVSAWVGRLKRRRRGGSAGRVASGPAGSLALSEAGVRVDESRPAEVGSSE